MICKTWQELSRPVITCYPYLLRLPLLLCSSHTGPLLGFKHSKSTTSPGAFVLSFPLPGTLLPHTALPLTPDFLHLLNDHPHFKIPAHYPATWHWFPFSPYCLSLSSRADFFIRLPCFLLSLRYHIIMFITIRTVASLGVRHWDEVVVCVTSLDLHNCPVSRAIILLFFKLRNRLTSVAFLVYLKSAVDPFFFLLPSSVWPSWFQWKS